MASWIIHLRIADKLINKYSKHIRLNSEKFIMGNIAPDSAELNEDSVSYIPPYHISHWQDINNNNASMKDIFFKKYITESTNDEDGSFYLGYYVHLFTDVLWNERILSLPRDENQVHSSEGVGFSRVIKNDWYLADVFFIRENPSFYPYHMLKNLDASSNTYFDYFNEISFNHKIKEIIAAYDDAFVEECHSFPYFNVRQVDEFVDFAFEAVCSDLQNKIRRMAFDKLAEIAKDNMKL